MRRMNLLLLRSSLLTIYELFVLAITGVIREISKEKLYQELRLHDECHICIKLFRQNYLLIYMK